MTKQSGKRTNEPNESGAKPEALRFDEHGSLRFEGVPTLNQTLLAMCEQLDRFVMIARSTDECDGESSASIIYRNILKLAEAIQNLCLPVMTDCAKQLFGVTDEASEQSMIELNTEPVLGAIDTLNAHFQNLLNQRPKRIPSNTSELIARIRDYLRKLTKQRIIDERILFGDTKSHELDNFNTPALTANQAEVLKTMAMVDGSLLLSAAMISEEMPCRKRLSDETIRMSILELIDYGLAERPKGERQGARLTRKGRTQASKIED